MGIARAFLGLEVTWRKVVIGCCFKSFEEQPRLGRRANKHLDFVLFLSKIWSLHSLQSDMLRDRVSSLRLKGITIKWSAIRFGH